MVEEQVILVDSNDNPIGTMNKMEAHEKAVLHRAFSVFILNDKNEVMLQQRAAHKYHSPLLWTNTCCSHQRVGETNIEAGKRRLFEEMGFTADLKELFHFIYKAPFDNGLTEHELDHVMIGYSNENPVINPEEVESWKWMSIEAIKEDMTANPNDYTVWFKIIFDEFYHFLEENKLIKPLLPITYHLKPKTMKVTVSRKAHFNAAHRLYRKDWSMEKNQEVFGKCNNPNFHGHNYELIVSVTGEVDKETGYVIDTKILSDLIKEHIEEAFDHKNLNVDVPEFKDLIPSAEHIAYVIWQKLRVLIASDKDLEVTLYETPRNFVTYKGE
jgi:isopentenyl-diphosphate Delta-isomerase